MNDARGDVTSIFDHPRSSSTNGAGFADAAEIVYEPYALGSPERAGLVEEAKRIYAGRRHRERYLPTDMFGEPAWDLLLILYVEAGVRPLTVSGAALVTNTPHTTSLRWIGSLESAGLVLSHPHATDRRLRLLALTTHGRAMMDQCLTRILRK